MDEMILIGDNKELLRSLYDALKKKYQVQMCSPQPATLNGVAALIRPQIIVMCTSLNPELDRGVVEWLERKQMGVPTLILASSDQWDEIKELCVSDRYRFMIRPVTVNDVVDQCDIMLGINPREDREPLRKKRVMIVDDSPLVLRNTKAMLDEWYEVFVVPDGDKALGLIARRQPDIVLLDYEMPGMNGRQIHEAMKAEEDLRDIPVIFLTNISDRQQVLEVLKSNPAGYILKPADKYQLFEMIEKVLADV